MENALYYTLSTVSQTLAGALAVMVAFVLLRLPGIDSAIRSGRHWLHQRGEHGWPFEQSWPLLLARGWEGLRGSERGEEFKAVLDATGARELLDSARDAWGRRPKITRLLYAALGTTATTIAFCSISLACVPSYLEIPLWPGRILFLSIVLLLVCLVLYSALIIAIVGRRPE
jgi:hypothetical protein